MKPEHDFIDALRECLGLAPLHGADPIGWLKWDAWPVSAGEPLPGDQPDPRPDPENDRE